MKHRINTCRVNLRSLPEHQLERLIDANRHAQRRLADEYALLAEERASRNSGHLETSVALERAS